MNYLLKTSGKFLVIMLISMALLSCQKECAVPKDSIPVVDKIQTQTSVQPQLTVSATSVQLLQCNSKRIALNLQWTKFSGQINGYANYTIEASMSGSKFTGWVTLGTTDKTTIDFSTEELNQKIRQLFVTGFAEDVMLRVKMTENGSTPQYSFGASIQVTTFQPVIAYDNSKVFRIPGNFQRWKIDSAQVIVSPAANGEYEGYIDFTNAYPQFLIVKSDYVWNPQTTFYYIGNSKFGYGGSVFSVMEGAGIYKFNASTQSNTWSCTKIDTWRLYGTAMPNDGLTMQYNTSSKAWEITGNFTKGSFVFKANRDKNIIFGHNATSQVGVPDYNGTPIEIAATGNYTIGLSLLKAGNYSYSIQRNA